MKDIGEFLKQKRLEKGLTIEEIVDKTRMPITRIKAIEEGNMYAFKDDITYLQFFIQSYCRAIDVDFKEIKAQLDESILGYTTSFQSEQLRTQIETENNIREKSKERINEYKHKNPIKKVKRKIDFSLISFIAVISILFICLFVVGAKYVKNLMEKPVDDPIIETPIDQPNDDVIDDDKPQPNQPEDDVIVDEKTIEVNMNENDVTRYVIQNAEEKFMVKIEFHSNSWFQVTLDGFIQSTPQAKVYDAGSTLEIELDPTKNKELSLRFGYFAHNKMFVDGQEVIVDESIANVTGVQTITFELGGLSNESAQ